MSAFRPALKPRRGGILIALAVASAAIALVATTATAGASSTHKLVFRLSGSAHQDVIGSHRVTFVARCPEDACTVAASASSESPSFTTSTVHAKIAAHGSERVLVPLTRPQRGKLKAAFEAGHSPTLTVDATAHDSAGNEVPLTLTVRPKKP